MSRRVLAALAVVVMSVVTGACATAGGVDAGAHANDCLLYTSPSPRDRTRSRMPSYA